MEAIAVGLVKDFVADSAKSLLGAIISRIGNEIALAWGLKADLRNLQQELRRVDALLLGADNVGPSENTFLDDWVRKVRAVAYQAEDVLDEHAYEVLKRKLALNIQQRGQLRRPKTTVRFFFSWSSNPAVFRIRMAHRVRSLKESIGQVYADANHLGIKPINVASGQSTYDGGATHDAIVEDPLGVRRERPDHQGLIGRDHDQAQIIDLVRDASNTDQLLSVVGVFGMAGLGKTSLCRRISQTEELKGYFDEQIWICVSHDFTVKQLLNDMVKQVDPKANAISSIEAGIKRLQDKLKGKKYVLVLDDVWDTLVQKWEPLRSSLQDIGGAKGTTILVTSRMRETIANLKTLNCDLKRGIMNDPCIYALGFLTKKDDVDFDERGNVESCKMHDVVHTLARVVSREEYLCLSLTKDESVNGVASEIRHLSLDSEPSLSMELGNNLRTLIASSASIPRMEFIMGSKCLRALSMVNVGLVELPDSIGELKQLRYLDISENNKIKVLPEGLTKLYNLQTLRVGYTTFSATFQDNFPKLPQGFTKLVNLRHLSAADTSTRIGIPANLGALTRLQTLPILDLCNDLGGKISELGTLNKLKGRLTIMGLENVEIEEANKVNLGTKGNIAMLGLSWADSPGRNKDEEDKDEKVLGALQPHSNLGALDIRGYPLQMLPQWVMEMTGYGGNPLSRLVSLRITGCGAIEQLPSLKNLVALRSLFIENCTRLISPPDLEQLTSLQELRLIKLSSLPSISSNGSLESCTSLRQLKLHNCYAMKNLPNITPLVNLRWLAIVNCTKMTCLPVGISNLPNLELLEIGPFSPELTTFPFPDDINLLSKSLRTLAIHAQGMDEAINLPNQIQHLLYLWHLDIHGLNCSEALQGWLGNLTSLTTLSLRRLPCDFPPSLPSLENLVALQSLEIECCKLTSLPNLKCFPSLNRLILVGLKSLRKIDEDNACQSSSSLHELVLGDCDGLEDLPDFSHLPNLKNLKIEGIRMTCWPAGISNLSKLSSLSISPLSPELHAFPFPNDANLLPTSLSRLALNAKGMNKVTSLPDQIQGIPDLKALAITGFKCLEALPEWLGDLTSLRLLCLGNLPLVKCLPVMKRLTELKCLYISHCTHLKELYGSTTGSEWSKIKHIADVEIY
ncbi:hypothetical protein Cgig2_016724 [Carnegiea gigantea]|uniref:Uncharacterized protein n=1 Tax=Carnegiea gigantea TaxID=171969 RepID=A0A9Q1QR14_9CARY|nr:hypothetical protein Cgig2_016724 [Carnegiea gigantea]